MGSRIEHGKPLRIHADVLRHRLPLARIPWAPDTTQLPELIAGVSSTHVAIAQRLLYIEARLATDVTMNLHMHDSATLAKAISDRVHRDSRCLAIRISVIEQSVQIFNTCSMLAD